MAAVQLRQVHHLEDIIFVWEWKKNMYLPSCLLRNSKLSQNGTSILVFKDLTTMNKEGRVREMQTNKGNIKWERTGENKDNRENRTVCRRRLLAGTRVEHCSQGISVRKATEAGRLSVLRVCVFADVIECRVCGFFHSSHIILGHNNSKKKKKKKKLSIETCPSWTLKWSGWVLICGG